MNGSISGAAMCAIRKGQAESVVGLNSYFYKV